MASERARGRDLVGCQHLASFLDEWSVHLHLVVAHDVLAGSCCHLCGDLPLELRAVLLAEAASGLQPLPLPLLLAPDLHLLGLPVLPPLLGHLLLLRLLLLHLLHLDGLRLLPEARQVVPVGPLPLGVAPAPRGPLGVRLGSHGLVQPPPLGRLLGRHDREGVPLQQLLLLRVPRRLVAHRPHPVILLHGLLLLLRLAPSRLFAHLAGLAADLESLLHQAPAELMALLSLLPFGLQALPDTPRGLLRLLPLSLPLLLALLPDALRLAEALALFLEDLLLPSRCICPHALQVFSVSLDLHLVELPVLLLLALLLELSISHLFFQVGFEFLLQLTLCLLLLAGVPLVHLRGQPVQHGPVHVTAAHAGRHTRARIGGVADCRGGGRGVDAAAGTEAAAGAGDSPCATDASGPAVRDGAGATAGARSDDDSASIAAHRVLRD
mmetsp:Transcript_109042/g.326144  ORF Transcript_109042/g.326144 Transcript_109042/m.326144 type:complete len:438 (+) Transcript_109042:193-1506(+)